MLDFRTVGKLENGAWAIEIFDEPFKTKEGGTLMILNEIAFKDDSDEVSIDYQCDFSDSAAVQKWLEQFIQEALEHAIDRAEALGSAQDNQTSQTP